MNKQEVLEIRRLFTKENSRITRICGCYITAEKEKRSQIREAFASLPEEEMYKYLEIFRKTFSGTIGRNLINMEFPMDSEEEGGSQHFLLALRDSALKDEELLEMFYDTINRNYAHPENYLILLIHGAYDIPNRGSDGAEMYDASEFVYHFVVCALCPVNLSKPALFYNESANHIESRVRDWIVGPPELGFLFPAFDDRNTNIHGLLYYAKDPEQLHPEISEDVLGCALPGTAKVQRENFQIVVQETLGDEADLETVRSIHDTLQEWAQERKEAPEPVVIDKADVRRALEQSGVKEEKINRFDACYDRALGEKTELPAANILNTRKFEIKTPEVRIQVQPDRADLVETKIIDGRPCLVIELTDEVEVNGIRLNKWE